MWNRALNPRDAEEVLFRLFHTLRNGGRDFLGFAVAHSHHAVTVANDNKRGEAEATTTFDHLGTAVDVNDFFKCVIEFLTAGRCRGGGAENSLGFLELFGLFLFCRSFFCGRSFFSSRSLF